MRKMLIAIVVPGLLALGYLIWPFWSALQLKLAVKAGDIAAIERKVEWTSVRTSLRKSLLANMALHPGAAGKTARAAKAGIWQSLKARFAPRVVDQTVARMVTPVGLSRLFAAREGYRRKLLPTLGLGKPAGYFSGTWLEDSWIDRFSDNLERIERIVFTSPTRVEIEIIDRYTPDRHYITVLQLKDFNWKLVGLRLAPQSG